MPVHVAAIGAAAFGRRPESLVDLLVEAGDDALEGIGRKTIDLVVVGNMLGGAVNEVENLVSRTANRLGLETSAGYRVEAASASGAAAFHVACTSLLSGAYNRVLVLAGEKMTDRPTAEIARALARSLHPSEERIGATMPALAALVAERYRARYDTDLSTYDQVAVQERAAAVNNPMAQFRTPVNAEEVATSRVISTPLRLLHCAAISDGAAAVVVERGSGTATVLGIGQGFESLLVVDRPDLTTFQATRIAAQRAYEAAHLTRKEVAFAEVHDAFAPFALINLEDLGICGPGEAGPWFTGGDTLPSGRFPVNPSGGHLGRGHPVGASGLIQIAEVARQLSQQSGKLQLSPTPRIGLAQSIGGFASHNFVTILGAEVAP
ncbi:MAG: thiolase family protein [Thermoplasmata archaeon]